ncbi:MAG: type I secretion system permease/ATPase [Kiloniellales bacterium]
MTGKTRKPGKGVSGVKSAAEPSGRATAQVAARASGRARQAMRPTLHPGNGQDKAKAAQGGNRQPAVHKIGRRATAVLPGAAQAPGPADNPAIQESSGAGDAVTLPAGNGTKRKARPATVPAAGDKQTPEIGIARGTGPEWRIAPSAVSFEDPLLSCLAIVAGLIQKPVSEAALKAGLPHGGERFTPELVITAAQRAGLGARLVHRPKVANILTLTLPCILLLKGGNACVLTKLPEPGTAEIISPEGGGAAKVQTDALQQQYSGYAIFLRAEFKFDARSSAIRLKESPSWFWGTLKQFWPIYNHVVLASIMINCFALASPLFIMNVYDRVVPNNAIETLWVLALGVMTVFGFEFVMRNMRTYFVDTAGKNADVMIASKLLEHVMAMRLDKKPPSTGALASNLREFESLREFFTSGTLVAFVDLPFVLLFIVVVWLVAGPVAIIPLAAVPLVIGAGVLLQGPLRRVIETSHQESTQKHALLFVTIDGLETIKAVAAEGRVQRAWERFVGKTAQSAGRAQFISGLATTIAQFSIQMATVAVVVYGVHRIAAGEITMGALIAATILTGRALQPLGTVAAMLTRLQQSRVALKALDTIMKAPVEREVDKSFLHRPHLSGSIELKNVSFAYPGQQTKALDGMSFTIRPGERVGILGRVGSGKSTVARLLLGLYEPAEGAVLMDGTDIRQIDPADLRRNVGYVSQDNYLFFGSVRDNVTFGAPHVDQASIARAAGVAGVTDFLRTHPLGFDLPVGERGMALSGGQRQAVVIARALLQDPPILMLDEPTSAMDNVSEAAFKSRLAEALPGKTLLLVTHRGSLLSLVDRLIVIDAGRIVADGPKEVVLAALKGGKVQAQTPAPAPVHDVANPAEQEAAAKVARAP